MDRTRPYKHMTTVHSLAFIGITAAAVIIMAQRREILGNRSVMMSV